MSLSFKIATLQIDALIWTPVIAPFNCNNVGIKNAVGNDILIRTDLNDSGSEDTIVTSGQELITAPPSFVNVRTSSGFESELIVRFRTGTIICYLKSTVGVGQVKLRFVF